jgi:hypothetical protein
MITRVIEKVRSGKHRDGDCAPRPVVERTQGPASDVARTREVTGYVTRFDQRSLAWAMMTVAAPHLAPNEQIWLWVKIGAGDLESALMTLVGVCMRNDVPLSVNLAGALRDWLDGYAGTDVAAAFESYVRPTRMATGVSDVRSTRESLDIACDRFGSRARRVPTDRRSPGVSGERVMPDATADELLPRGHERGLSP